MLQFENSRAGDQVWGILFETNWRTGLPSTFVQRPPSSFLISSPCLGRPPLCCGGNLFVVHLHRLIPRQGRRADVSPSAGQFSLPAGKWNPLGVLVGGCEKLRNSGGATGPSLGELGGSDVPPVSGHCKWSALIRSRLILFSTRPITPLSGRTWRPWFCQSACWKLTAGQHCHQTPLCHSNW